MRPGHCVVRVNKENDTGTIGGASGVHEIRRGDMRASCDAQCIHQSAHDVDRGTVHAQVKSTE